MEAALAIFAEEFRRRVLSFDGKSATLYAELGAMPRAAGHPIAQFDCQIATMTRARDASLATHNTKDFHSCGIDILDPWPIG